MNFIADVIGIGKLRLRTNSINVGKSTGVRAKPRPPIKSAVNELKLDVQKTEPYFQP